MKSMQQSTPHAQVASATPTARRRVRIPSGGEPMPSSAVIPVKKVEISKLSAERQLEILEKLEADDYDRSAGTEQWLPPPTQSTIKIHQQNLAKMNAVFGSVPMNIGQTNINQDQVMQRKPKFDRVVTLSDSELNMNHQRQLFLSDSVRSVFSSPTESTASYDDEQQEEGDFTKGAYALLASVDIKNKARWTLFKRKRKQEIQGELEFDDLISKIKDINTSFERLKMNDRLGSIDVNKLYPSLEKSSHFLPCPIEGQLDVVNCFYSTSDLCHALSEVENGLLDFSENDSKEKLCSLETKIDALRKWINFEEKETTSIKEQLEFKTKLFSVEEVNECSNFTEEGTLPSIIPTPEECVGIVGYDYEACNKSF